MPKGINKVVESLSSSLEQLQVVLVNTVLNTVLIIIRGPGPGRILYDGLVKQVRRKEK